MRSGTFQMLDPRFKKLYRVNQLWFKYREGLTQEQGDKLDILTRKVDNLLSLIVKILERRISTRETVRRLGGSDSPADFVRRKDPGYPDKGGHRARSNYHRIRNGKK